jgi:hypothetical protein
MIVFQRRLEEERLAKTLGRCLGPVIAIGRPGEALPELGAYRLYISDQHWKKQLLQMLEQSQLVVMRLGASGGVLWEMKQSIDHLTPSKIVLYSEPPQTIPAIFLGLMPEKAQQIPPARFVYFDDDWSPHCAESIEEFLRARDAFCPTWYMRGTAGIVFRVASKYLPMTLIVLAAGTVLWLLLQLWFLVRDWP